VGDHIYLSLKIVRAVVLFDLDGTLIDSTEAIVDTFYYTFEKFGINFYGSSKDIEKLIGYPLEDMYRAFGVEDNLIEEIVLSYKDKYQYVALEKTSLIDNAISSLQLASSFATLGIVTTKTTKYTLPLLKYLDILKYFKTIVGRMEVTHPKPHPEPILTALKNLKVDSKENVFMIGDTKLDLISAQKAKVCGIGVLTGYGTKEELSKYSSFVAKDSLEAVKIIQNMI